MIGALLLIGLCTGLATAEFPCELYDVTTLARLLKSDNQHQKWSQVLYEVYSRTNAVGLQTNFQLFTYIKDPLENSELNCRNAASPDSCRGWNLEGFSNSSWHLDDSFLDWQEVSNDYEDHRNMQNKNTRGISSKNVWGRYFKNRYVNDVDESRFDTYKVRFRLGIPIYFGSTIDDYTYEGVEVSSDSNTSTLNLEGTLYDRFPSGAPNEDISQLTNSSNAVGTVFGTFHNGKSLEQVCIRQDMEINMDTFPRVNKKCFGSQEKKFRIITYSSTDDDFQVYQVSSPMAMSLTGLTGTVLTPVLIGPTRSVCLSMKYFLEENDTVQITFSAVHATNDTEGSLLSTTITGSGTIETKQFHFMMSPHLINSGTTKIKLSFRASDRVTFSIRSFRRCSYLGEDLIFGSPNPSYKNNQPVERVGFSAKCPHKSFRTFYPGKKCYNGGINVEDWCQCLPGFRGHNCEQACPPHRFGGDCGGMCNRFGSVDCKGIKLAGPGQPLECARGYTGLACDEECPPGFYGPNCRLTCGNCLNSPCDRFTGTCGGFCQPGFVGDACQNQLASLTIPPEITEVKYHTANGFVRFDDSLELYPVLKIKYKKKEESAWKSQFFSMQRETPFELYDLSPGEIYQLFAVPVNDYGDSFENISLVEFATQCDDVTYRTVTPSMNGTALFVKWDVQEIGNSCRRLAYNLEISSAELAEPILLVLGPNETNSTVQPLLLHEGSVRLRSVEKTNKTSWSDYVSFTQYSAGEEVDTLEVKAVNFHNISFFWKSKEMTEDTLVCEAIQILCDGSKTSDERRMPVKTGKFVLKDLTPFTKYSCRLEYSKLTALVVTNRSVPTLIPSSNNNPLEVTVTNTSAHIFWKKIMNWNNCTDMNGILKGLRLEVWNGNILEKVIDYAKVWYVDVLLEDLSPETSYLLKIFFVNDIGWNTAFYASIPFQTKDKAPDAVKDLAVYKVTRSELWLRWKPPAEYAKDIKYRVIVISTPSSAKRREEIVPRQYSLWPDYAFHRVRGLAPDIEYHVTIEARKPNLNLYGPPTSVKSVTREREPAAPENVQLIKYNQSSITLMWEIPVLLNSNPKFFVVTLDQIDEYTSSEKPTTSVLKNVPISEEDRFYVQKFVDLNPATTYAITVSAGNRGTRAIINASTPPNNPPEPPQPSVVTTEGVTIQVKGIAQNESLDLLTGYLLLLSSNSSDDGVFEKNLSDDLKTQFGGDFIVVHEFQPTLEEEIVGLSTEPSKTGKLSLIQNTSPVLGQQYRIAVAAVSTYCGSHSATISKRLLL